MPRLGVKGSLPASLFIFLWCWVCLSVHVHAELLSTPAQIHPSAKLSASQVLLLSQQPVWRALIHHQAPQPIIASAEFLLSHPNYSPELELKLSLQALFGAKQTEFRCRFPARARWISQQLNLTSSESFDSCPELQKFLQQVPTDKVQLIYAAENINQPSSMMGHSFLNFVGQAADGTMRQHAISFYTELDSVNVPQIIFSSLVTGRDAVFMVSPYLEKRRYYQEVEQRNVIEYELQLDATQRQLMQLHVWELGQIKLPYYFHRFNCATLTQQLLAIAESRLTPTGWLSPLDVVKNTQQMGLIGLQSLEPSTRWYLRALQYGLAQPEVVSHLRQALDAGKVLPVAQTNVEHFYLQQLALNYLKIKHEQGQILPSVYDQNLRRVQQAYQNVEELQLTLSRENDPVLRPADSQWSLGYIKQKSGAAWQMDWQPASHQLTDDNRQLSSESALQLMSLQVRYLQEQADIQLLQLTLYRIQNFIPWDPLSGGWSAQFAFGFERQHTTTLQQKLTPYVAGGLGRTYQMSRDLQFYGLLNAGIAHGNGDIHMYGGPEVGAFLYEIGDMKSTISLKAWFNMQGSSQWSEQLSWRQSWFFRPEYSLQMQLNKNRVGQIHEYESMLQLRFYY